ncbi:MAG TPA: RluA family pseudouridine synthase [Dehalococcoidia bacterium]|nr:RluA family pseudouridine synthase [Dehalococcoidia bacterium]
MKTLELTADRPGERLDVFLSRAVAGLSRSRARRLIDDRLVTVDGAPERPSYRLPGGARVTATLPPAGEAGPEAERIPLTIVYQDEDVIVVDKAAGLTVHPAPGHATGTLVNALLALVPELAEVGERLRPGIVHRLDRDTSGLLVVARNERARADLVRQLKQREVSKTYLALVRGVPKPPQGTIEAPIGRHPRNRKKMAVVAGGREAETRYRLREEIDGMSLLEVEPVTGRTHQIRVHLAATGHPVIGDAVYGKRSEIAGRQFLHAWRLAFDLPSSGRRVEFESPLPADLRAALARLRA